MKFYLHQYLSLISFLIIPLVIFWNPSWLSLMGYQAYWPIFWLLPWALIHGPFKSMLVGFLLGFILDTINTDLYTQIPGLMLCGFWFGQIGRFFIGTGPNRPSHENQRKKWSRSGGSNPYFEILVGPFRGVHFSGFGREHR